jgi:hypothetical protein
VGFVRKKRGGHKAAAPSRAGETASAEPPTSKPAPARVETSLGALALFPQRFEDIGAFSKLPPDAPSSNRLRLYLQHIAARAEAPIEDGEWPRIDEASSHQLSDDDLERIAEAYLSMPERRPTAEGAGPISSALVRADGESATGYLDRVLTADHERQMEDLKGTYESLHNRSGPPLWSALADVDRQASSLRDVATRSVQSQDRAEQKPRSGLDPSGVPGSIEGIRSLSSSAAEIAETDRLKGAHDEEMALTRSIGIVTTQSAILVASLSETATRFLRQFAETTQESEEAARASARTVLIAVVVVGIFAAIAAAALIANYLDERENRQAANQWRESVLRSMQESAAAQAAQMKSLEDRIRELSDRQNALAAARASSATADAEASAPRSSKPASSKRASKRTAIR